MRKIYNLRNLIIVLMCTNIFSSNAQDIPFNCDYNAYLFQYNDIYAIDLASGNSYLVAEDITTGNINAAAYNPADGYIWGSLSSPAKTIVRIGKNFTTSTFYIDELPTNNRYVGDISSDGIYYLKGGGATFYKINLDPNSENYSQHQETANLSQSINIHDWAFNSVDGNLYTVEKNSNILYRINPTSNTVTSLGEVPILSGLNYTYGAVYFDASGRFYVSANQTGTIYVIQDVQNLDFNNSMTSNLFAFGPSSSSNDGARCPTAPVPQEICDNGIDDDGDGLIDCEDPSCSGFGVCDVIQAPTSGSNDGGLESNNRLSEQINKRNFNRAKTGYRFSREKAKRITKSKSFAERRDNSIFTLQDFIPIGTISEDEAIDATPFDLLEITNASDIYGVDYLVNNTPIASVLALKTDTEVYEHTKYICDRLLGAELISVSTILINDVSYIKSIIKNIDGTYEYVLSFSAKEINNGNNFGIESHWNLDRYESGVTFYNFQIWSNTVDNLYLLGQEVINLLNQVKPITSFDNSMPPTVFVRKGQYRNGSLDLEIVNTNATDNVLFDAGYRTTETTNFESINTTIDLNANYITNLSVNTGQLFDIGFRIGDGISTPDDLFMSDGPWGIDDSQDGTEVSLFNVSENNFDFDETEFPIERNIELHANTNSYVAAYRAITPRFKAVNFSEYNTLKFSARGTGNLEITFVKASITNWEEQYKTNITLSNQVQDFELSLSDFINNSSGVPIFDDVVTIVFTMASEDGTYTTKELYIENLRLSQENVLSSNDFENYNNLLIAYPNPVNSKTTLAFTLTKSENISLIVYDQTGKKVNTIYFNAKTGRNEMIFNKGNLSSGLYFCRVISSQLDFKPLKLIIN